MAPTRLRKRYINAALCARKGRERQRAGEDNPKVDILDLTAVSDDELNEEETTWQGGVLHNPIEWSDTEWEWEDERNTEGAIEDEDDDEVEIVVDGIQALECLGQRMQIEEEAMKKLTWNDLGLVKKRSKKEWKKLTQKTLGRAVQTKGEPAESTLRRHRQLEREEQSNAESSRKSGSANSFRDFFGKQYTPAEAPAPKPVLPPPLPPPLSLPPLPANLSSLNLPPNVLKALQAQYERFKTTTATGAAGPCLLAPEPLLNASPSSSGQSISECASPESEIFLGGYVSDYEEEESDDESSREDNDTPVEASVPIPIPRAPATAPPLKRQKLAVPAREARRRAREAKLARLQDGLTRISKHIVSKKTEFAAGAHGLQSKRARAIESCLRMVVKGHRTLTDASERSAESHGLSADWGGRLVRIWVHGWLNFAGLPSSARGCHAKTVSILDEPANRDEILSYLRSYKWATNPEKFSAFIESNLITPETQKYLRDLMEDEIPKAFRKYVTNTLFPRIGVKAGHGMTISMRTARAWLANSKKKSFPHSRKHMAQDIRPSSLSTTLKGIQPIVKMLFWPNA
ncbi:hypothetical protein MIND_00278700 [Mycena indigotica]|uniref:Uncharacterized protein n=1 Tax=Mycena indigotica TaxID=2126181 RepID=A0A8H6WDM3_9AGAR|nr:uncharacterized protein MIND_00278700 [Mycena indigotica]KAF7312646.1 hypothetical protein MIND_00278700 [Mycena indigotica]